MKRRKIILIFIIITSLLAAAAVVTAFFLAGKIREQRQAGEAYASLKQDAEKEAAELTGRIASLESEKDALESELAAAIGEKEEIIASFGDKDSLYGELNKKFESLNAEIALRDSAIEQLKYNIEKLEGVYRIDIAAQLELIGEINALLADPLPIVIKNTVKNEDGTFTEEIIHIEPKIALYYEDIENGYKYAFNADKVFDPASMIKAPFILSLLEEASAEEERIGQAKAAAQKAGDTAYTEPERLFDMTKKITYTKDAYYQSGSGEIIKSEDGTEYTYRDLFYHVLECSDNVAYDILKKTYGTGYYGSLAVRLSADSMVRKPSGMSAADACKCMKAIYEFTESGAYYAAFMKDAMIGSAHLTMIPYAVAPYEAAHKYGWDEGAYNDMAIVYAENPYVVSVMSNYDRGGKEVNEYIQSVIRLVNELHEGFYEKD